MPTNVEEIALKIRDIEIRHQDALSLFDHYYQQIKNDDNDVLRLFRVISPNCERVIILYVYYMQFRNWKRDAVSDLLIERANSILNTALSLGNIKMSKNDNSMDYRIAVLTILLLIISEDNVIPEEPLYPFLKEVLQDEDRCNSFMETCRKTIWNLEELGDTYVSLYTTRLLQNFENISDSMLPFMFLSRFDLTVSERYPESTLDYIRSLYQNKDFIKLQYLLRLFADISYEDLGSNIESFFAQAKDCSETETIAAIKCIALLSARKNSPEEFIDFMKNETLSSGIDTFVDIYVSLYAIKYGVSDALILNQNQSVKHIEQLRVIEDEVFGRMLRSKPDKILSYLRSLGNANYYKHGYDSDTIGFVSDRRKRISTNELLSLSKINDNDQLIYIYLNSYLKRYVPIETLFQIIYSRSTFQYEHKITLSGKYVFKGTISHANKTNTFYLKTDDFLSNKETIKVHVLSNYQLPLGTCVNFQLAYFDLLDDYSPVAVIDCDQYPQTKEVGFPDDKYLFPEEIAAIGMQLIDKLSNCADNQKRVDYLKSIKNNPFDLNIGSNDRYIHSIASILTDEEINKCKIFMKQVIGERSDLSQKSFIFLYSLLRFVIPFDDFIDELSKADRDAFIDKLNRADGRVHHRKFGKEFQNAIRGIVVSRNEDSIRIEPLSVILSGRCKFVLCRNDPNKDMIISGNNIHSSILFYFPTSKTIILNRIKMQPDLTGYYLAMNKAGNTMQISDMAKVLLSSKEAASYYKPGSAKSAYKLLMSNKKTGNYFKPDPAKLAYAELCGIELRLDSRDDLMDFVRLTELTSPWKETAKTTDTINMKKDAIERIEDVISRLCDYYDVDDVFFVYFNTCLKTYGMLEFFVRTLLEFKPNERILIERKCSEFGIDINPFLNAKESHVDYFKLAQEIYEDGKNVNFGESIQYYKKAIEENDPNSRTCVFKIIECMLKLNVDRADAIKIINDNKQLLSISDYYYQYLIILLRLGDNISSEEIDTIDSITDSIFRYTKSKADYSSLNKKKKNNYIQCNRSFDLLSMIIKLLFIYGYYEKVLDLSERALEMVVQYKPSDKPRLIRTYKRSKLDAQIWLGLKEEAKKTAYELITDGTGLSYVEKIANASDISEMQSILKQLAEEQSTEETDL